MKTDEFRVVFSPFRLETRNFRVSNKKSGAKIAEIKELNLDMTMLDVFSASTTRNVVIDKTDIKGLDFYVKIDENGESNFAGIEMLPPTSSVRFKYTTARISIADSRLHFGDQIRNVQGTANDIVAKLEPNAERSPDSEDLSFKYSFASSKSTITLSEAKVTPVDIASAGVVSPESLRIDTLTINSPVAQTEMSGEVTDWASMTYELDISSKVNLSTTAETFDLGSTIAGIGNFKGKVTGKGLNYKIDGEASSDNLTASGVRLKALKITAKGDGESGLYNASGRAVAEMLTFGEYRIDFLSTVGNVRGNGADFKWFGQLRAAAVRSPLGSIAGLYLSDAVAEYREGRLDGSFNRLQAASFSNDSFSAEGINSGRIIIDSARGRTLASVPNATARKLVVGDSRLNDVRVDGARVSTTSSETNVNANRIAVSGYTQGDTKLGSTEASGVRITNRNGVTDINADSVSTDSVSTASAKTGQVSAKGLKVSVRGSETLVDSSNVTIAKVETDSAVLGTLNIAGVRLSVRGRLHRR